MYTHVHCTCMCGLWRVCSYCVGLLLSSQSCLLLTLHSSSSMCQYSSSPSSTAPQPHQSTLPGELGSVHTCIPSRLGVYMYITVTCVFVFACVVAVRLCSCVCLRIHVVLCHLSFLLPLTSPLSSTTTVSLHPLNHFHVAVAQSLQSLSLLLPLVSMYVRCMLRVCRNWCSLRYSFCTCWFLVDLVLSLYFPSLPFPPFLPLQLLLCPLLVHSYFHVPL